MNEPMNELVHFRYHDDLARGLCPKQWSLTIAAFLGFMSRT